MQNCARTGVKKHIRGSLGHSANLLSSIRQPLAEIECRDATKQREGSRAAEGVLQPATYIPRKNEPPQKKKKGKEKKKEKGKIEIAYRGN